MIKIGQIYGDDTKLRTKVIEIVGEHYYFDYSFDEGKTWKKVRLRCTIESLCKDIDKGWTKLIADTCEPVIEAIY